MTDSKEPQNHIETTERPTLKTISKLTGLAVATVSRALHDAPDISSKTKKRVRECADEIGYRPNRAGVRLRTGKTNVISLVISTEHDIMNHTAQLISSLAGELRSTPYHLVVTPFFPDEDPMTPIKYVVETRSADAIIINQTEQDDPRIAYLRDRGFPFATHGRTSEKDPHPFYDFDNLTFAKLAVEALARRNRRCILMIAPPAHHYYGRETRDGSKLACDSLGIERLVLQDVTSDSSSADIEISVQAALKKHPEIDGLFCASTTATMAAISAAEKKGHVLGKTIDAFAKEPLPFLNRFRSSILTVHENVAEAGRQLARATIRAIDEPKLKPLQGLQVPEYHDPLLEKLTKSGLYDSKIS